MPAEKNVGRLTRREWLAALAAACMALPAGRAAGQGRSVVSGVRIGAQSYSFRSQPLETAIASMQAIGLSFCELWQGHVETRDRIAVPEEGSRREALRAWRLDVPLDHFAGIRRRFDSAGIALTAYNLSFQRDFTDDEIRRGFEMARALGVDVITASAHLSVISRVEPVARDFGMRVAVHNHSRIAEDEFATPDDFEAALKGTRMIAINLDIGHFTAANFDAVEYLDRQHARIASLHIKDRKRDQGPNVPFGDGDTPIAAVLRRLRDRKWDIPAQIEYEYKGTDTNEEVRRCLEYCRRALDGG
jgi:sugar phosphate isomerase/epimerase